MAETLKEVRARLNKQFLKGKFKKIEGVDVPRSAFKSGEKLANYLKNH